MNAATLSNSRLYTVTFKIIGTAKNDTRTMYGRNVKRELSFGKRELVSAEPARK